MILLRHKIYLMMTVYLCSITIAMENQSPSKAPFELRLLNEQHDAELLNKIHRFQHGNLIPSWTELPIEEEKKIEQMIKEMKVYVYQNHSQKNTSRYFFVFYGDGDNGHILTEKLWYCQIGLYNLFWAIHDKSPQTPKIIEHHGQTNIKSFPIYYETNDTKKWYFKDIIRFGNDNPNGGFSPSEYTDSMGNDTTRKLFVSDSTQDSDQPLDINKFEYNSNFNTNRPTIPTTTSKELFPNFNLEITDVKITTVGDLIKTASRKDIHY